jgi:hypothetical protein
MHGTVSGASNSNNAFQTGNSISNFSQDSHKTNIDESDNVVYPNADQGVLHHPLHGTIQELINAVPEFPSGNSLNFNQEIHASNTDISIPHKHLLSHYLMQKLVTNSRLCYYPGQGSQGNNDIEAIVQEMDTPVSTPVRSTKRRENSVDEDSSTRAESLKAKKNLGCYPVL